ncbi:MAG TPA: GNAT family N-acetyltransferase [Terriglobia bacterium]|nr:GNAT family N-acetyltransferase [Terriglobia bacterium]
MVRSSQARYSVRPCRGIGELEACIRLQKQIWGYADSELYPLRLFVNLTHIGGHVIGAFCSSGRGRAGELVGFVSGMPAWRDGKRYVHSLSLGVARGHENQGLGRMLKAEQREVSLQAGIARIEWTFDPLRAKNAFFNIVRLGAITRRYQPDYYGHVESRLQQGLPSDRLVCEWWLNSARVRAALAPSAPSGGPPPALAARGRGGERAIEIPLDLTTLAEQEPDRARKLQRDVRRRFEGCFRRGLAVTGFERGDGVGRYLLEPYS